MNCKTDDIKPQIFSDMDGHTKKTLKGHGWVYDKNVYACQGFEKLFLNVLLGGRKQTNDLIWETSI